MKKVVLLISLAVFVLLATACGASGNSEDSSSNATNESNGESITIEHELDTTEVTVNPKKVVVFDFGALDTLDKLGVEVAGVPKGNIPTYLEKYEGDQYENVGSLKEPDFEKIAEINPDLILISARQSALYDQLVEIAPTVYVGLDTTRYMESFEENMHIIGQIFDKEAEIEEELGKIEELIASLNEKVKDTDQKALIVLANDDKISAYGPNSRFGIIHDVFGIPAVDENIEVSTHGMNVSFEYVVEQDPDILYVVDRGAVVEGGESSAKQIIENKLMQNTKAYQNDNIVYLNPDYWYLSGGGLVSVEEMVNEVSTNLE